MSKLAHLDITSVVQIWLWMKVLFIYAIDLLEQYGVKKIYIRVIVSNSGDTKYFVDLKF